MVNEKTGFVNAFWSTADIYKNIADLDENRFILTDNSCKTKTSGIFAPGDCRAKNIRQLTTATSDDTIAALTACEYIDNEF